MHWFDFFFHDSWMSHGAHLNANDSWAMTWAALWLPFWSECTYMNAPMNAMTWAALWLPFWGVWHGSFLLWLMNYSQAMIWSALWLWFWGAHDMTHSCHGIWIIHESFISHPPTNAEIALEIALNKPKIEITLEIALYTPSAYECRNRNYI